MAYHLPSQKDQYYFGCINKALDTHNNYDKIKLTGDFNAEEVETVFGTFPYQHDLILKVEYILKTLNYQVALIYF